MKTITVTSPSGAKYQLLQCQHNFMYCADCGTPLNPGDFYTVCSDCGGIFCQNCVKTGAFENHVCEDENYD